MSPRLPPPLLLTANLAVRLLAIPPPKPVWLTVGHSCSLPPALCPLHTAPPQPRPRTRRRASLPLPLASLVAVGVVQAAAAAAVVVRALPPLSRAPGTVGAALRQPTSAAAAGGRSRSGAAAPAGRRGRAAQRGAAGRPRSWNSDGGEGDRGCCRVCYQVAAQGDDGMVVHGGGETALHWRTPAVGGSGATSIGGPPAGGGSTASDDPQASGAPPGSRGPTAGGGS